MAILLYILAFAIVASGTGGRSRNTKPAPPLKDNLPYYDDSMERE